MTLATRKLPAWLFPSAAALAVLLGVWLNLPSLNAGLYADDYLQDAMLTGEYPVRRSPFDLYAFSKTAGDRDALITQGVLPWWSHPELKLTALRPLASASLALDHRLGLSPKARHAVSLAWLALLIGLVAVWYRKVLPTPAASLGVLCFAMDPAHVSPAGWIANRTALMCAAFGVAALIATTEYLRQPSARRAAWIGLYVSLALASGEYGLGAVALAAAWLGFAPAPRERCQPKVRLRALACWLVPTTLYLGLHSLLGYGAVGSSAYVNLTSSPLTFLVAIVTRWPALLASELLLLPSELVHGALVLSFGWALLLVSLLVGVVAAVGWAVLRHAPAAERRTALALSAGLGLSLLPLVATLPSSRLLQLPSVAGAGLLGLFIWRASGALLAGTWGRRALLALPLAISVLLHLLLAPAATRQIASGIAEAHVRTRSELLSANIPAESDTWLMLNTYDFGVSSLPWVRHAAGHPLPRSMWLLTSSREPVRVERTGPKSISLSVNQGAMLNEPAPFLFRAIDAPLGAGEVVERPGLRVKVVRPQQYGYTRLDFEFAEALEAPRYAFLYFNHQGRVTQLTLPSPGQWVVLPPPPLF